MGQPDVPARRRADACGCRAATGTRAGGQGAALAARAGAAAAAADPDAGGAGRARRGLSLALVGLPLARRRAARRARDRRPVAFATDLAGFLRALRGIDARGGPAPGQHNFFRGGPLGDYDARDMGGDRRARRARSADAACGDVGDALASEWERDPVWFHGDVAAGNLLVRDGRLGAVIDFGSSGVGDPACDMAIAWTFLSGEARERVPRRAAASTPRPGRAAAAGRCGRR